MKICLRFTYFSYNWEDYVFLPSAVLTHKKRGPFVHTTVNMCTHYFEHTQTQLPHTQRTYYFYVPFH